MRHFICLFAIGLPLAASASGCSGIELKGRGGPTTTNGSGQAGWPFEPVAMRVHPFTSINLGDEDGAVLEARIELLDQVGDVTKGVGDLRFELYAIRTEGSSAPHVRDVLFTWSADLSTLQQNIQHYDQITRTYLFKLKLESPPAAWSNLLLSVQFTDRHGKRINAEGRLSYSQRNRRAISAD